MSHGIHHEPTPEEHDSVIVRFRIASPPFIVRDDHAQVTAFFSSNDETEDTRQHWVMCEKTSVMDENATEIRVWYHPKVTYSSLVFNIFAEYANGDEGTWIAEHHVCTGHISVQSLMDKKKTKNTTMEMLSAGHKHIGDIEIESMTPQVKDSMPLFDKDTDSKREDAVRAAAAILDAMETKADVQKYSKAWGGLKPKFIQVMYRGAKMPNAAVLASLNNVKADKAEFQAVFGWWLYLAKSNCSLKVTDKVKDLDKHRRAELIAEMFTIMFKGLVYATDSVRIKKNKNDTTEYSFIPEDQWTSLLMFPDLARACFDCEDGMITCVELLHAFRNGETEKNSELNVLQEHLKNYAICFALGQIRSNSDNPDEIATPPTFILHAFPLLIDRRLLQPSSFNNAFPTILLETTNYLDWSVRPDDLTPEAERVARRYDRTARIYENKQQQDDLHTHFVVHSKAPARRILTMQAYGLLHSIYSVDGCEGTEVAIKHYYAMNTNKEVGASLIDVLMLGHTSDKPLKSSSIVHPQLKQIAAALENESLAASLDVKEKGLAPHEPFAGFQVAFSVLNSDMQKLAPFLCENSPLPLPEVNSEWLAAAFVPEGLSAVARVSRWNSSSTIPMEPTAGLVPAKPLKADRYLVQMRQPGFLEEFVEHLKTMNEIEWDVWKKGKEFLHHPEPDKTPPNVIVYKTLLFKSSQIAIVDVISKTKHNR
jgi:hypothetical protein